MPGVKMDPDFKGFFEEAGPKVILGWRVFLTGILTGIIEKSDCKLKFIQFFFAFSM